MTVPRVGMVLNTMGLGGVPEVALQLMRHLPRDRFDLALCILKREATPDAARTDRQARFEALGVSVHYATDSSGKLEAVADVARWLDAERIAVLHTHSYRPNVYARLAGALCRPNGLRVVAHYHNHYDDKWNRDPVMLTFERQLAAGTDAMIAVSESVRGHVAARIGIGEGRVDVVSNGVDVTAFDGVDRAAARASLGLDGTRPVLGLIGRVCEQKGHEDFVEAAIRLAASHPDALCLMVGHLEDVALCERLRQRIETAGRGDHIRFLGHRTDIAGVYAALDVVVAPSRWEGFGLMLVEAMAAGRPVVASRVGAIPEVVREGETAILVPPRDPAALADALAALLADPVRQGALAAAGLREHGRFSWTGAAERVATIYDRVLAVDRGRP
jgi:glycosyltransferase involved in cell wall biosynthesis